MRVLGVDGCPGGWIAVTIDGRRREFRIVERIASAIGGADRVLVDIPIGLPESGRRLCDFAARRMLGFARSRVFLDVRRPLLRFSDYAAANAWGKCDGAGISHQLWNILPKIAEVDALIAPARQKTILESHPELVFARLAGGTALPNKKTREGRRLRRDIVLKAGFGKIDDWLAALPRAQAGADDLLDACVLAAAARKPTRLAGPEERDAKGLLMEMWY